MSFSRGLWWRMAQLADLTTDLAIVAGPALGILALLAIVTGLAG
jgi:hypothetical protein